MSKEVPEGRINDRNTYKHWMLFFERPKRVADEINGMWFSSFSLSLFLLIVEEFMTNRRANSKQYVNSKSSISRLITGEQRTQSVSRATCTGTGHCYRWNREKKNRREQHVCQYDLLENQVFIVNDRALSMLPHHLLPYYLHHHYLVVPFTFFFVFCYGTIWYFLPLLYFLCSRHIKLKINPSCLLKEKKIEQNALLFFLSFFLSFSLPASLSYSLSFFSIDVI